ncbi:MAG: hypothetical protein NSGCLCUN01_02004 [uncultured Clostridium sp.]
MKKVAIISSCSLPVPAVKGGAVETLIENIVKKNEDYNDMDLHVISLYDKCAFEQSNKYRYSKFIYFKKNKVIKNIDLFITNILKLIKADKSISSRNYLWKIVVLRKVIEHLYKNEYDAIIIENTIYLFNIFKDKKILNKYNGKYFFHVHNNLNKVGYEKAVLKTKKFIAISNYIKTNIGDVLGKSIKESIEVLHNGVDTKLFNNRLDNDEKKRMLSSLGIRSGENIVLFTGRITPEKGIKELLMAFNLINRENITLLIVGSSYFGNGTLSEFESEIINLIKTKNKKVIFTGYVHNNEIWKYYQLATVAVLPSIWDEPLGLTMIESKCSGIPLITTESGGIPETVNNKHAIILRRDNNLVKNIKVAIEEVIDNIEVWKENANIAKLEAIKENSLENYYKGFVDIIMN